MEKAKTAEIDSVKLNMETVAQEESLSRPERIQQLSSQVDELFQGEALAPLREDIKERSFNVPQYGGYHCEGILMDTHLEKILKNLDAIKAGDFHEQVPEEIHGKMQDMVQSNKESLKMYAFLHDISKADCLTIKYDDGRREEVSWKEWQSKLPEGINGDPTKMMTFFVENNISGFSYFHKNAKKKHGQDGVDKLETYSDALEMQPIILEAIKKHEVAYQFQNIKVKTYRKYFGDLTELEKLWVITASYIDTMASIRDDGNPNLDNFRCMVDSANNYEKIKILERALNQETDLDQKKVNKVLRDLNNQNTRIEESSEELIERIKQECQASRYDKTRLESTLASLVVTNQITEDAKNAILEAIDEQTGTINEQQMRKVKKTLRQANRIVQEALNDCEIK